MNNVTHLANFQARTTGVLTQNSEAIYFPVSEKEIAVEGANPNQPFKAILREDTGTVLAVHGEDYSLVKNEDLFPQFEEALKKAPGLDMTDMYVRDHISHGGGRVAREYFFPAHRVEIDTGDHLDLQLRVQNSYDGSWAFGTIVGAFRLICTNGMTIGEKFFQGYGRHTKNLDVAKAIDNVDGALHVYFENVELWKRWIKTPLNERQLENLLDDLKVKDSHKKVFLQNFQNELAQGMRPSMWSVFNALTQWSSHGKVRKNSEGNRISVQQTRENEVRRIVNSDRFLRLAA